MTNSKRVDVLQANGSRIYKGMIDDPILPYLHWGDGHGFLTRDELKRCGMQVVEAVEGVFLAKGDRVKPASKGDRFDWTKLRGIVVDVWADGQEDRAEIRWDRVCGYPMRLPVDLLEKA